VQGCRTGPREKNKLFIDERNAITMDDDSFVFSYTDHSVAPKSDESSSFDEEDDRPIVYENDDLGGGLRSAGAEAAMSAAVEIEPEPITFAFHHIDASRYTDEVVVVVTVIITLFNSWKTVKVCQKISYNNCS